MIDFIQIHYTEIIALLPAIVMLIGLSVTVGNDYHIRKRQKRTMLLLIALVFSLIAQNYLEYLLCVGPPMVHARRLIAIYGYGVWPVILLLFLHIVSPDRDFRPGWVLVGINAALYACTAFNLNLCFSIDESNSFSNGVWPFGKSCLAVSLLLLAHLLHRTLQEFRQVEKRIAWIPAFTTLLILLSLLLDGHVGSLPQPISFLTLAVVIDCVLYYNWLHLHFVRGNADGRGTVTISTREYGDRWEVCVADDGPGFDPQAISGDETHVGIRNVRERLRAVCGGTIQFEAAAGGGTLARIVLPKDKER